MSETKKIVMQYLEKAHGQKDLQEFEGKLLGVEDGEHVLVWVRTETCEGEDDGSIPDLVVSGSDFKEMNVEVLKYMADHPDVKKCRADVVSAMFFTKDRSARVRHMVGAVEVES